MSLLSGILVSLVAFLIVGGILLFYRLRKKQSRDRSREDNYPLW
jgi:Na+-driven multidrug efflux pump